MRHLIYCWTPPSRQWCTSPWLGLVKTVVSCETWCKSRNMRTGERERSAAWPSKNMKKFEPCNAKPGGMVANIVSVYREFGVTVHRRKTGIMCTRPEEYGKVKCDVNAAGHKHTGKILHFEGCTSNTPNMPVEIARQRQGTLACYQKYWWLFYDTPSVGLEVKVRMAKAGVVETLLYGSMSVTPLKNHFKELRQTHHGLLPLCISCRKIRLQKYRDYGEEATDPLCIFCSTNR